MTQQEINELDVSKTGLHAHGAPTWIIAIGIAIGAVLYGYSHVSGMSTNSKEHTEIRAHDMSQDDQIRGIESKLNLIIALIQARNQNQ